MQDQIWPRKYKKTIKMQIDFIFGGKKRNPKKKLKNVNFKILAEIQKNFKNFTNFNF